VTGVVGALLLSLAQAQGVAAPAPTPVRGVILDAETEGPIQGALVTARGAVRAVTTDRLGGFTIWIAQFPDTLRVVCIGRKHASLRLSAPPSELLHIRLEITPLMLSDVIVTAPAAARPLEDVGRWQVPIASARGLPPAIETDVLRALSLVPAVSFSTPLSARPVIRGYDAGESSVRIDGFEVLNLYHLGRVFSAFPADAASQVTVATAPPSVMTGGTLAGTVDVTGQVGEAGHATGGADLSLASLSGWGGGGGRTAQGFIAVRAIHFSVINAIKPGSVPYDFQDLYANTLFSHAGQPVGRITAFASRDHLFDRDLGSGMDWSNLLLGARWQAFDDGLHGASLWASANRFAEDAADVPARSTRLDLRNRFERITIGGDGALQGPGKRMALGFSAGTRSIANRITPLSGVEFVARDIDVRRLEWSTYAELTATLGRASLQTGIRMDAAGRTRVWQPRARAAVPLATRASLGIAAGRTAMLYHLVSDPHAEPDLAFYDFWLGAGEADVPVPVVDHATIDLDVARASLAGRLSLFASRGRGLMELRPISDQRAEVNAPFRSGRSRGNGLEVQLALRGDSARANALSASYVLSWAQREWDGRWVPWSLDRRHVFRLDARRSFGKHWSASVAFEAMSGVPLTPIDGVLLVGFPDPRGGGVVRDSGPVRPAYVYGEENSARSSGTARVDLAARYTFTGPGKSRMMLGFSVLNAGFGPVAPLRPNEADFDPSSSGVLQGRVRYERTFDLPPVPTLTLRIEF
jgi:TonB-dependent receptor-like protein